MFVPHTSTICRISQNLSMNVGGATLVKESDDRMALNRFLDIHMPRQRGAPLNALIGCVAHILCVYGPTRVPISIHRPIKHRNSPYRRGFSAGGRLLFVQGRIVVLMNDEKNPSDKFRLDGSDKDKVQKVSSGLALCWTIDFHWQMLLCLQ